MKTETTLHREQLVHDALQNAMTYEAYATLVNKLASEDKNTGPEITESLANYTLLNNKRMQRWSKKFMLTPEDEDKINAFESNVTWLVLTESWCGDAAQTMPMMEKISAASDHIDLKVILRDEHLEVMDQFLTNGGRSIPKLIAIDNKTGDITGTWGPRPTAATQMAKDYKAKHGSLTPEFKQDLQVWYNKDKGRNTTEDLLKLLK